VNKTYKDLRGACGEPGRRWQRNYEAVRYRALASAGYENVPRLAGVVSYIAPDGTVSDVSTVMEWVHREDEVGGIFWHSLDRYLKAYAGRSKQGTGANRSSGDEAFHGRYRRGAALAASEIAKTIARMHAAFLQNKGESFRAVKATDQERREWSQAPVENVRSALTALLERQRVAGEETLSVLIGRLEQVGVTRQIGDSPPEGPIVEIAQAFLKKSSGLCKAQTHGDLHCAQGLIISRGEGPVIERFLEALEVGDRVSLTEATRQLEKSISWIDLEGVPAKDPVDDSHDGRDCPLADLAGVGQALCYIANIRLYQELGLDPKERFADRDKARRASLALAQQMSSEKADVPGLTAELVALLNDWMDELTEAFIDGYLTEAESIGLAQKILAPWDKLTAKHLVYFFILARAAHELRYETYGRDWAWDAIPGGRILQLVDFSLAAERPSAEFVHLNFPHQEFLSPIDAAQPVDGLFLPLHHIRTKSDWGIADFETAKAAIDLGRTLDLHFIQFLPVTYSGAFHSPYSVASSLALDPEYASVNAFISYIESCDVDAAPARSWIDRHENKIKQLRGGENINHDEITRFKLEALEEVWDLIGKNQQSEPYREFLRFTERNQHWLIDHLLYLELKQEFLNRDPHIGWDWRTWDRFEPGLSGREPEAIARARQRHAERIQFASFVQFILHRQLKELVEYGKKQGVFILLDLPFSPPEADVWIDPDIVGLKKENGFRRTETQGVPAKKESLIGQNWQFTAYDWSNQKVTDFFCRIISLSQEFGCYIRLDHVLGFYRLFLFRQDTEEKMTLHRLGLFKPIMSILACAREADTEEAKDEAIAHVSELIETTLDRDDAGLPADVREALFDDERRVRRGGNMIMVARKVLKEKPLKEVDQGSSQSNELLSSSNKQAARAPKEKAEAEPNEKLHGASYANLPPHSVWQRWHQIEDQVFADQPLWDYIRISPNERAGDAGFLREYLFPDDGAPPPQPTDSLRVAYYRLAPAEKILSEFLRLSDERGSALIFETLGTVPLAIQESAKRIGGYNYYPVIWGLERSSFYHPTRFVRSGLATFTVADSASLVSAWESWDCHSAAKWNLLHELFPFVPDDQLQEHSRRLTDEVKEKLLSMVYAPTTIYPELDAERVPLLAVCGLQDLAAYPEEFRLNRPGELHQWMKRLPDDVCIENLRESACGRPSTQVANQVVASLRSLQRLRRNQQLIAKDQGDLADGIDSSKSELLRVRPDVEKFAIQIRQILKNPSEINPFYVKVTVSGRPQKIQLLVVNQESGFIHRFPMREVFADLNGKTTTCWGAAIRPRHIGTHTFLVEVTSSDGSVERSKEGYLCAVPEHADLNPLSDTYYLKELIGSR
jgi:4-alpha-glucanotransferase/predicted trehalose synthase